MIVFTEVCNKKLAHFPLIPRELLKRSRVVIPEKGGFKVQEQPSKWHLTETDIITKYILPTIYKSGWDNLTQIRQEVKLRDGKVVVRGQDSRA